MIWMIGGGIFSVFFIAWLMRDKSPKKLKTDGVKGFWRGLADHTVDLSFGDFDGGDDGGDDD